jgi:hypothetical protein
MGKTIRRETLRHVSFRHRVRMPSPAMAAESRKKKEKKEGRKKYGWRQRRMGTSFVIQMLPVCSPRLKMILSRATAIFGAPR